MSISEQVSADGPESSSYKFDGAALPYVLAEIRGRCPCDGGVKSLMIAVMEDGIRCFLSPKDEERSEAEQWMQSHERGYVFAFLTICDALELDGAAVYESLRDRREAGGFVARRKIRTRSNPRRRGRLRPKRQRRRRGRQALQPLADAVEASAA